MRKFIRHCHIASHVINPTRSTGFENLSMDFIRLRANGSLSSPPNFMSMVLHTPTLINLSLHIENGRFS